MSADYFSTLKVGSKPKYGEKLDIVGLKDCSCRLQANIWWDNPYSGLKSNTLISMIT